VSRYINDPRVTTHPGPSYTVTHDGKKYLVMHTDVFGWVICHYDTMEFVVLTDADHPTDVATSDRFAIGINDADAAIAAIIGTPA
jgi:hypothetical protein